MLPSLQHLYAAFSPNKKGHLVKPIFKDQDLVLRAPGFWFHFTVASHSQFSLPTDLTSSGRSSVPFPVCRAGYACLENRPGTDLWCWGQAG